MNCSFFKIIFAGPFEHHSNLLPWREIGAEVCYLNVKLSEYWFFFFLIVNVKFFMSQTINLKIHVYNEKKFENCRNNKILVLLVVIIFMQNIAAFIKVTISRNYYYSACN